MTVMGMRREGSERAVYHAPGLSPEGGGLPTGERSALDDAILARVLGRLGRRVCAQNRVLERFAGELSRVLHLDDALALVHVQLE